jgi:hypothetical protein
MELARLRSPVRLESLAGTLVIRRIQGGIVVIYPVSTVSAAEGLLLACPLCEGPKRHFLSIWTWKQPEDVSPGPERYHFRGLGISDLTIAGNREIRGRCGVRLTISRGLVGFSGPS